MTWGAFASAVLKQFQPEDDSTLPARVRDEELELELEPEPLTPQNSCILQQQKQTNKVRLQLKSYKRRILRGKMKAKEVKGPLTIFPVLLQNRKCTWTIRDKGSRGNWRPLGFFQR